MGSPLGLIMIPELPKSVDVEDCLEFYATLAGNLQDQSSVHVNWHTHRQNPSVCWICDMNTLLSKVLYYTKSSLDIETTSRSENDSDAEIESDSSMIESLNYEEEPVPEYETEPETEQVGDQS